MRDFVFAFSFAATLLALPGCSGGDESAPAPRRLELLTWWTERSELDALDALLEVHRAAHPNVEVAVLSSSNHETLVHDVQDRLAEGNPPAAFQENLGGNALRWAESAESLEGRAAEWVDWYQPAMLELVTAGGELIGVPLAITRQNAAYYNKEVLDELGMDIPEGNARFLQWLEDLAGRGYTQPLCAGDAENWVSAHILFEDIVPAHAGARFSRRYWSGQLSGEDPEFVSALEFGAKIAGYFNRDLLARLDMARGVERLTEESAPGSQCIMAPMGDWGGAILGASEQVNDDFVQRPWPGSEDVFVLNGDAFIAAKNQQEAFDFFATVASREGQIAFNSKKGSVPARTMEPADFGSFGVLTQQNMSDLASDTVLPGFKVIGDGDFPWDALNLLTHDFFLTGDPEPIVDFMREHYAELAP